MQTYRNKILEGDIPSVVILDLTIRGGMGGLETAKAILEVDPTARLIVASGYSTNPVMANHRQHGFAAALAKPYRLEDISIVLEQVLRDDYGERSRPENMVSPRHSAAPAADQLSTHTYLFDNLHNSRLD